MKQNYRFSQKELLKYQHIPHFVSGEEYLLGMACLNGKNPAQKRAWDFVLRAKTVRDGLQAVLFSEENLRKKGNDRDLCWTVTDEGNGKISLWSQAAGKYLTMNQNGAKLSVRKQTFSLEQDGEFYIISAKIKGDTYYLRASGHQESPHGLIFTSGRQKVSVEFALLKRLENIPATPESPVKLTVGTMADVHIDYGLQLFPPYQRKSTIAGANSFRRRYDLDALITCGDNISDNGSGGYRYGGAMQGKWPRERVLKTQARLHRTMQKSFRDPEKAKNVFLITGNHDTQVGDRQPEGKRFNSGNYDAYLPEISHPLRTKADGVDVGSDSHLLCYQANVKGVPFLMLNTPRYPFDARAKFPDRFAPAHTMEQADWLEERLNEIEKEQGKNAVVFVVSHYPLWPFCFATEGPGCPDNRDVYVRLDKLLNRYPNLFYFYGHVHGGQNDRWVDVTHTAENGESRSPVNLWLDENNNVKSVDSYDRACFRSDLIQGTGFNHVFAGSMAFFRSFYFANDGKNLNSWLCEIEVPFFQGLAVEVYDDRVVLTMQNLGTKKGVYDYIPGATYKLKPLVYLLKK